MKVILSKAYFKAMSVVCGLQIKDNDDIQYFNENDRFLKAVIIFFQPQNVLSREEKGPNICFVCPVDYPSPVK